MKNKIRLIIMRLVYKVKPMALYRWSKPHYFMMLNESVKSKQHLCLNREKMIARSGIGKTSARSGVSK